MKEVKTPKKPLAYYYGIVLIVLIVFNLVVTPILMKHQVKDCLLYTSPSPRDRG